MCVRSVPAGGAAGGETADVTAVLAMKPPVLVM